MEGSLFTKWKKKKKNYSYSFALRENKSSNEGV